MYRFVFSCGDINGIGPEIIVKALQTISKRSKDQFIICIPKKVLLTLFPDIKDSFQCDFINSIDQLNASDSQVIFYDIGEYNLNIGHSTAESGKASFKSIISSLDIIDNSFADAIVTAPISKHAFKIADIDFPGHTELLANRYSVNNYAMMFLGEKFNSALATIHIPIKKVSSTINVDYLTKRIEPVIQFLINDLNITKPRIAVLGFNPHAGEQGNIGSEELDTIVPFIDKYNQYLSGPFVPDAFFGRKLYMDYDLVFGIYHDQVLIPFKLLHENSGVNYTAGLPIIRTSPDHGTAFDIAGKNIANPSSLIHAYETAKKIVKNRK